LKKKLKINNMDTIKITKKDLDKDNFYKKDEVGTYDNYENCNVEIDENLGYVRFKKGIYVNGYVLAKAGSGIKAGWGIKAGLGIEAGWGIEAGLSITCKLSLSFFYRLFAGTAYWKNIGDEEKTITCGKLEPQNGAKVEYGIVKEIGLPK
jgi:hypothetical protein